MWITFGQPYVVTAPTKLFEFSRFTHITENKLYVPYKFYTFFYLFFQVLTIVNRPEAREDIKSLPALAATIVLWAPETAIRWERKVKLENPLAVKEIKRDVSSKR